MYQTTTKLLLSVFVLVSFSYCSFLSTPGDGILSVHDDLVYAKRSVRQLRAAQIESHIGKRSIDQALRYSFDFDDKHTAAQVHVLTKIPTLNLEEIGHHVDDVQCFKGSVSLDFVSLSAKEAALEQFRPYEGFYLVTSHDTCNHDGERKVYLVSSVSSGDVKGLGLTLSVSPVRWKDSIQTIRIEYGKSEETYRIPYQGSIQKRQATSTSEAAAIAVTSTGAASTAVDVTFPVPASSSTPTATSARQDLGFSWIDTPLLPPSFPGVDSSTLNAPLVPHGVSISCKNCTVTGTIDILQASISGNATNSTAGSSGDDDKFSWDEGSFTFEANGFSAHIEMEATVQPSATLLSYNAPLPDIGIPGFQIPGIGVIGPVFRPIINIGTQISSELDFTYGFNLTVPDNSSIILDLSDPENSSVNGFPNSQITPLPFSSTLSSISLTVTAAFRPELLLGISLLRSATLGAGIFFNLPTVSATVSQVAHVNAKCEPIPNASSNSTTSASTSTASSAGGEEQMFDSLTHVDENVEFDFGILAEAEVGKFAADGVVT
ncbi:MAG: hypothetical protein Q9170_004071, partial [Blastenia crenularia]